MRIKDHCPSDSGILSPKMLLSEVDSFTEEPIKLSIHRSKIIRENSTLNDLTDLRSHSITQSTARRNKKMEQKNLKKIISNQKRDIITSRFIQKIKLNNVNSPAIEFDPYQTEKHDSFASRQGIEMPDIYDKILSFLIAFFIIICIFIDTTGTVFPEILQHQATIALESLAILVFIIEFLSSCFVVKMVEGKKVLRIKSLIFHYLSDGLLIDIAYLIVISVGMFTSVGYFRLIILLKIPEFLERLERLENTFVNTFYSQQYWGLAKVFLLNFALAHILSLLLLSMTSLQPENNWLLKLEQTNEPWTVQYVWGYYWGTTIMLTVGFGDLTPANYEEAICLVLIETFSCLALAYNINCVGNLISNIKSQDIEKNKSIKTFKILSNRNDLTEDLELKIHNYIEESTNIKKKFNFEEESNFISTLPVELKADFLKESNKKIFESLIFFKGLTEKTLLAFAEAIQMKICHPEQIVKKRGEIAGLMILKQGSLGLCTKLSGSDFNSTSIQKISIKSDQDPKILSLDFISQEREIFEMKSEQYSVLYFLSLEQTLQTLKTSGLDIEHYFFLKDRSRNSSTEFEVFDCQFCSVRHTKFTCPKLHFCPMKKHVIDKYLFRFRQDRNERSRSNFERHKKTMRPFKELQNNLKLIKQSQEMGRRFNSWKKKQVKHVASSLAQFGLTLKKIPNKDIAQSLLTSAREFNLSHNEIAENEPKVESQKMELGEYKLLLDLLKDEIGQAMNKSGELWTVECDEVKNYKYYYFPSHNASTLSYKYKRNGANNQILI